MMIIIIKINFMIEQIFIIISKFRTPITIKKLTNIILIIIIIIFVINFIILDYSTNWV